VFVVGDASMTPELTLDERLAWVWSTVENVAELFDMDDDRLTYSVFEPLDIDAGSALSEANLTALVAGGVLAEHFARELIAVGNSISGLIKRAHERKDYSATSIRQSALWARVAGDCRSLLARRRG
jgi:hypothetical protein